MPTMNAPDPTSAQCPRFNFLLEPEFPLNALILASDALRIANQNSGRHLFDWSFVSLDGEPVRASNGMWFSVDCAIDAMPPADVFLLFEGNLPTQHTSRKLLGHLRTAARFGGLIGGVDTGAFALAQAGIVATEDDPELALHWEAVPTFQERFPQAVLKDQIYLINRNRAHCAGGVATLDMTLDLIARFSGQALANEIANALVHSRRDPETRQRGDGLSDVEVNSLPLRLVRLMEQNLDFPLSLAMLADELGVSQRTLSRVCKRALGQSPMRLYLHIRLQAARNFLFYEEFTIKTVAVACGFSYPAVFSRVFKQQFGQTPREFRDKLRENQNLAVRPEIQRLITRPNA
ncbi:MAG: GlxA family transcriptional regulator [Hyphomicrobiales bacterium]|nr:GlxA family transcriptional regulator [Hyphomicrobiales bacterium]